MGALLVRRIPLRKVMALKKDDCKLGRPGVLWDGENAVKAYENHVTHGQARFFGGTWYL